MSYCSTRLDILYVALLWLLLRNEVVSLQLGSRETVVAFIDDLALLTLLAQSMTYVEEFP